MDQSPREETEVKAYNGKIFQSHLFQKEQF